MSEAVTVDQAKQVALQMNALFDALAQISPQATLPVDPSASPVGLRDTGKFNLQIAMISRDDITAVRRDLVSAISAEKWFDGFVFAMQLVALLAAA